MARRSLRWGGRGADIFWLHAWRANWVRRITPSGCELSRCGHFSGGLREIRAGNAASAGNRFTRRLSGERVAHKEYPRERHRTCSLFGVTHSIKIVTRIAMHHYRRLPCLFVLVLSAFSSALTAAPI